MKYLVRRLASLTLGCTALAAAAQGTPLKLGVGLFSPDKERKDATCRPIAQYPSAKLGRPMALRTVDTWEGLANDKAFVSRLQAALAGMGLALATQPALLPAHDTGFIATDNAFYKSIRAAGLATGKLQQQ